MRARTVVISLVIHGAIAATLLGAAGKKAARRATSVAFTEEKKKAKPTPPKPPPPPPRPAARPPERKLAAVSKALPEPVARVAAPAPVETALAMSNDDAPGGIALGPREPTAKAAAAAPTKVASAVTESRKQHLREAANTAGGGEEAPCNEEPTKPVPIAKQPDIELTASARAEGVEGRLILSLTIGADGTVTGVRVTKSLSAEMDAAAEAAVKQWRFKPAMACGKAMAGTFNLGRTFELGD